MVKSSTLLMLSVGCLLFLEGCSDPAKKLRIDQEYPTWPELTALQSDETMMPVGTAMDFGDLKTAKEELKNPAFKSAVDAFDSSDIPGSFATDERKAAKDEAVKFFREAIELAENNGSNDKVKTAFDSGQAALRKVTEPIKN